MGYNILVQPNEHNIIRCNRDRSAAEFQLAYLTKGVNPNLAKAPPNQDEMFSQVVLIVAVRAVS